MVARSKHEAAREAALEAAEAAQAAAAAAKAAQAAAEAARLAALEAETEVEPEPEPEVEPETEAETEVEPETEPETEAETEVEPETEATAETEVETDADPTDDAEAEAVAEAEVERRVRRKGRRLVAGLGVATVVLGCLAVWSHQKAQDISDDAAAKNTALTDNAATSQVKGEISTALNKIFSYDYTNPGKTDQAARAVLTGKAVGEYDALFASVRQQAPAQKLVLTTTVTYGAVRTLQGDRARLLFYADQQSTSATSGQNSAAAAMLAVDALRQNGHWKITNLDTFAGH